MQDSASPRRVVGTGAKRFRCWPAGRAEVPNKSRPTPPTACSGPLRANAAGARVATATARLVTDGHSLSARTGPSGAQPRSLRQPAAGKRARARPTGQAPPPAAAAACRPPLGICMDCATALEPRCGSPSTLTYRAHMWDPVVCPPALTEDMATSSTCPSFPAGGASGARAAAPLAGSSHRSLLQYYEGITYKVCCRELSFIPLHGERNAT